MTTPNAQHAQLNDFVRKDGAYVRVIRVAADEQTYYTSDGGLIGFNEVKLSDVFLESEVYDKLNGNIPDAVPEEDAAEVTGAL